MRTFCITLPETPERTEVARAHFEQRGVPAEMFHGIHGEKFGLSTRHKYTLDDPAGYIIEPRHVGMCLSHYMLWQVLYRLPGEHFLVLEDDAEFPADWQARLDQALRDAPCDFDILLIGSGNAEDKDKQHIKGAVWEVKYPFCTHAMVLSCRALPVLLTTQRKIWAHIDIALYFDSYPHLKVYTVLPRIVEQRDTSLHP
jgi:GR25 family glycosyltransferase involved in LPS biosynthesis